ncbi:MAG: hypothetical protein ACYDCC_06320 [Actinomycetota bacterium]
MVKKIFSFGIVAVLACLGACSHADTVPRARFTPTKNVIDLTVAPLPKSLTQTGTPKCLEFDKGSQSFALVLGVVWKAVIKKPQEYAYALTAKSRNGDQATETGALTLNPQFPTVKQITLYPKTVSPGITSCTVTWTVVQPQTSTPAPAHSY